MEFSSNKPILVEEENDRIHELIEEYKSFIWSVGHRRVKAVEWAVNQIERVKPMIDCPYDNGSLLRKVGWSTFVGLGLYCGLLGTISTSLEGGRKLLLLDIGQTINDVIRYTDNGYDVSFEVLIAKADGIKFGRTDKLGNIFIFPADAEELLAHVDEVIND